jgi:DNA-binding transcriptional MerR regulator
MDYTLLTECVERRLLPMEDAEWGYEAYIVACRIRRLSDLGVNIQGIEVALHMRERLLEMQEQLEQVRTELDRMRGERDREIARLLRELSDEVG